MFKTYFLTIKLNLMKKLNLTGRSFVRAISLCVAFMFLGASAVSAQNWVTHDEAILILRNQIDALDLELQNAPTMEEKLEISFRKGYYYVVVLDINSGNEIPAAVSNNHPQNKPELHSSGMVAFSSDGPNFKEEVKALVNDITDLLSD